MKHLILVNLKDELVLKERRWPSVVVGLMVAMFFVGVVWFSRQPVARVEVAVTAEEKLVIIELIDRVETKYPDLRDRAKAFRKHVLDEEHEFMLSSRANQKENFLEKEKKTYVPSKFFDWDSLRQEHVVLKTISLPPHEVSQSNRKAPAVE